jgi:hypothetical protein
MRPSTEAQKQRYLNDIRTENDAREFFNLRYGLEVGESVK